jgi:hypothetical protein
MDPGHGLAVYLRSDNRSRGRFHAPKATEGVKLCTDGGAASDLEPLGLDQAAGGVVSANAAPWGSNIRTTR